MRSILFCTLPYSFSILKPIAEELKRTGCDYLWYLSPSLLGSFPFQNELVTSEIEQLKNFNSEAIFVPGNEVPWYLPGVKVQVFHGLAGEKKGHFRIRDYFDLYLTQGPYFTERFRQLAQTHKNFKVVETGWCKLDKLFHTENIKKKRAQLLESTGASKILLYAPTFSPSLTSADEVLQPLLELSEEKNILILIKFHDKMNKQFINKYLVNQNNNFIISNEKDIIGLMQIADVMLSDTSSVVYEFILLNKPVVTLNSASENISWENHNNAYDVMIAVRNIIEDTDVYKTQREDIISQYHPYTDGQSANRMLKAVKDYIDQNGVPKYRKIPFHRKLKIRKKYPYKIPLSAWL